MNAPLIQVGASPDTIRSARNAIVDILSTPAADACKIQALAVLKELCGTGPMTVRDCSFVVNEGDDLGKLLGQ